jgi:hypothetical protein
LEKLKNAQGILSLMHVEAGGGAVELNSQVSTDRTEIVGLELLLQVGLQLGDKLGVTAG